MKKIYKIITLLFLILTLFTIASCKQIDNTKPSIVQIETVDPHKEVYDFLNKNYYKDITKDDKAYMNYKSLVEYVNALGDKYTKITPIVISNIPTNQEDVEDEYFQGIGVTTSESDYIDYEINITGVEYKMPAFTKLYPGDKIIGVSNNNSNFIFKENKTKFADALSLIRKKEGEKLVLLVKRGNDIIKVELISKLTHVPSVETYNGISDDVSVIRIHSFSKYTHKYFEKQLKELEKSRLVNKSDTLVIDVRNNPGGRLDSVAGIVEMLLPKTSDYVFSLIQTKQNNNEIKTYGKLENRKPYNIKILVNNNSASASEVLAASLHYSGGYEVIGDKTFGKNVFQSSHIFPKLGVSLNYTGGYWYYYNPLTQKKEKISDTNYIPYTKLDVFDKLSLKVLSPSISQTFEYDNVDSNIVYIQKFLSFKYDKYLKDNNKKLRTDGYFDLTTKQLIEMFQKENSIKVDGKYSLETKNKMYDQMFILLKDMKNDPYYKYFEKNISNIKHNITINSTNGVVKSNITSAFSNSKVILTVEPNPGYYLEKLTVNLVDIVDNSFLMPNKDAEIVAVFKPIKHSISINYDTTKGYVDISKTNALTGNEIILDITTINPYKVDYILVDGIKIDDTKFIMPDKNVLVDIIFRKYKIIINQQKGGHITVDNLYPQEEEKVILNVFETDGYMLKEIYLNDVLIHKNEFEMPQSDAIIRPVFIFNETYLRTKYAKILQVLKDRYYKDIDMDMVNKMNVSALSGFISALGDRYTFLFDPKDDRSDDEKYKGYGISLDLSNFQDKKYIIVSSINKNSSVQNKLYVGDKILGFVDTTNTRVLFKNNKYTNSEATKLLRPQNGNLTRTLIIQRLNEILDVEVSQGVIQTPTVEEIVLSNSNFSMIKINQFSAKTAQTFEEILKSLEQSKLQGNGKTLIIDVRNNPGGYVTAVGRILELLIPRTKNPLFKIEYEKDSTISSVYYGGKDLKHRKTYDIKVLVNSNSASASEVLASVMHYSGGYEIVGSKTFGKNVFQSDYNFKEAGLYVHHTLGYWHFYNPSINKFDIIDNQNNKYIPVSVISNVDETLEKPILTYETKLDMANFDFIKIQKYLNIKYKKYLDDNNLKLRIDGYYDSVTKTIIEKFQTDNNLNVTGIYDINTGKKLYDDMQNHIYDIASHQFVLEVINGTYKTN